MNYISTQLQLFLRDTVHPQNLAGQQISEEEFSRWKSFLKEEISGTLLAIQNSTSTSNGKEAKDLRAAVAIVYHLSNTVNRYLTRYLPVWKRHNQAKEIKTHYKYTIALLNRLQSSIYEWYPSIEPASRVTNFALPQIKMELRQQVKTLEGKLTGSGIQQELQDLVTPGFIQLINKKNLTIGQVKYIEELLADISMEPLLSTQLLTGLLIVRDFNLPEFFLYCVNNIQDKLDDLPGLHEQKEFLLQEKNMLYDLALRSAKSANVQSSMLYRELNSFLDEKYLFLKQLVKVRKDAMRDQQQPLSGLRFKINLSVPQFGLFIRMQMERDILSKEKVGDIFEFFAHHFYTANTALISPESLQKKSTDVEFTTAQKMKGHLIGMLNWLNTNYNLSNYN
ncbi:hypothetical protein SAMN05421821_101337 [Mucilaginibacter lappiensis]|uniref:Uncharacterized protein n=1 Tax=Mucilaginibacter lappiensis TaxID=354630 RepID=A0ABR6PDC1_9SPHI|nr:hypothetical protein [Mucilaginibacter lappiensis]MBB6107748.1 hypothetical protein [Mucilaginibacter lappiensis]SIP98374.1 hypothetical protein SAMN05421821_101337 [Mucilaginibacter lappiensis]